MSQRRRLTVVLTLNLAMIVGLVVTGLSAHSLGAWVRKGQQGNGGFAVAVV